MRNLKTTTPNPALPMDDDTNFFNTINNLLIEFAHISLQFQNLTDASSLGNPIDQSLACTIPIKLLEQSFDWELNFSLIEMVVSLLTKNAFHIFGNNFANNIFQKKILEKNLRVQTFLSTLISGVDIPTFQMGVSESHVAVITITATLVGTLRCLCYVNMTLINAETFHQTTLASICLGTFHFKSGLLF